MKMDKELLQKLQSGEEAYFKALGRSMLPFFPSGTVFVIRKVDFSEIKIGDLIFFINNGEPLLHRIIRKNENTFVSKGDFLSEPDGEFPDEQLLARAVGVIFQNRYVSLSWPIVQLLGRSVAEISKRNGAVLKGGRFIKRLLFG